MYKWNLEKLKIQVGIYVRLHRLRKGISQFQLAIEVGLSKDYIGLIERGKSNPTLEIIVKICNYIDLDISMLFSTMSETELNSVKLEIDELEKKFKNQNKRKS